MTPFIALWTSLAVGLGAPGHDLPAAPLPGSLGDISGGVVAENAEKNGSTEVSTEYLNWLYSPEAQDTLAENHYRTTDEAVTAKYAAEFPEVKLLTVDEVFGGWQKVQDEHLAEGGILDKVFVNQ